MSHVPHELHEEFPDEARRIHDLKLSQPHFARLADSYHEVNRNIHRAETEIEPIGDEELEALKKERLRLKDEIAALLRA